MEFIAPHFDGDCVYFTGTYSDEYGYPHGMTLPRNVVKDFRRFLERAHFKGEWVVCAEPHADRNIHHLHGILAPTVADLGLSPSTRQGEAPWGEHGGEGVRDAVDTYRQFLKSFWAADKGHARVLPMQDGCVSYVTKYVLKDMNADSMDWSW